MGGLRRIGAVAVALTLLGGMTACGGDDDGGDLEASGSGSGTEDETTTTEDDSGGDDASDDNVDVGDIDFGNLEECSAFAAAYGSLSFALLGGGLNEEEFSTDEIIATLDDAVADAPDDVQDAMETVSSTYQEVFENLQDAGIDFESGDPSTFASTEFLEAIEPLEGDEFNDANILVSEYLSELCAPG